VEVAPALHPGEDHLRDLNIVLVPDLHRFCFVVEKRGGGCPPPLWLSCDVPAVALLGPVERLAQAVALLSWDEHVPNVLVRVLCHAAVDGPDGLLCRDEVPASDAVLDAHQRVRGGLGEVCQILLGEGSVLLNDHSLQVCDGHGLRCYSHRLFL